jgi:hypothetical protein
MLDGELEKARALGATRATVVARGGQQMEFDLEAPVKLDSFMKPDDFEAAWFYNPGGGWVGSVQAGGVESWIQPNGGAEAAPQVSPKT